MMTNRDHLDEAIDLVAERLTRVEDDDLLAARIVAALPERRWWLLTGWAPRLAVLAGLVVVLVTASVLQRSNDRSTQVLRSAAIVRLAELVPGVAPDPALGTEIVRRTFVARSLNIRRTAADHDRALASLVVTPLAANSLPEDGFLSVEPLAIVSLPLATESLSLPE